MASGRRTEPRAPISVQSADAPLTATAIFLVLSVSDAAGALDQVRSTLADITGLAKTVAFRGADAAFSCTVGIGATIWAPLMRRPLPAELRPFPGFHGAAHVAPSTPGDLLFHVRADRRDLCFEFERLLLSQLRDSVHVEDETVGFRYFDVRDLLGFVDGTANPIGDDLHEATVVGDEDPMAAGGSYVVVQKYTHQLDAWNALSAEDQEAIMGRSKADNVELDDAPTGQKAHKTLATVIDENGEEHDILRDNMPFGSPASGEVGTYFIAYARNLWVVEQMLTRMFVGDPPGMHDRLLDFSTAVTGSTFFVPPVDVLSDLEHAPDDPPESDDPGTAPVAQPAARPRPSTSDGSLGIAAGRLTLLEGLDR
ncbi:Dyp-type peroxidase [Nocardioides sp. CER19]|uniref:Dyp-type peroxidase n=1 Tax=Nocardioides sp. CER19 TaxID=3038538 RepID=UPI002449D384|nr:Dyp-type peroxidase [Nocardioides sp. CER19]MDH2413862.1 Dyp-type peroxidase [Nocardioides sp. CER19]